MRAVVLSLLPGFVVAAKGGAAVTLGSARWEQDLYSKDTFTCKDSSREIAKELVNDDYCDCADGKATLHSLSPYRRVTS